MTTFCGCYRLCTDDPNFFGFIPSPASPLSVAGDILTSLYNVHAGTWFGGSGVSFLEKNIISWLADRVGLPKTSGGLFCSGGSIGNLTALAVARDSKLDLTNLHNGSVYLSAATHFSVHKALHILGLKQDQLRLMPVDESSRMKVESLQRQIALDRSRGKIPFAIIATCGTTNSGSIDFLADIADVAEAEGMWMHVDGAYGASVVLSNNYSYLARGLNRADSISWDAHKWLFQTYGCAMVLFKDKTQLAKTFALNPSSIQHAAEQDQEPNFVDHVAGHAQSRPDASFLLPVMQDNRDQPDFWSYGIELTRPARVMKLWFTLRALGSEKLGSMIDHGIRLAEFAESSLRRHAEWSVLSPAKLGIIIFRFYLSDRNEQRLGEINSGASKVLLDRGLAGILPTNFRGSIALRMCIINPKATNLSIEEVLEAARTTAWSIYHKQNDLI